MKKVIIYTGDLCIHCNWAIELLNRKNIKFTEYNIAKDTVKREEMFKKSNGVKTVPQIFIGEHHVGGNVELQALERDGKLSSLLGIQIIKNKIYIIHENDEWIESLRKELQDISAPFEEWHLGKRIPLQKNMKNLLQ